VGADSVGRTRTATAATWIGVVAQFALPQVSLSLAPLRGYAITRTLSRIGTADGCRGQDPTAPPDWLSSPLQLGMADGRDYVTGTAVGAPVMVVLAACAGLFVGVVFYLLGLVRSRLWLCVRRTVSKWRGHHLPRSNTSVFSVEGCAVAAASGGATLMATAAAIVSQAAAAAAVLRLAEGAVDGTPDWYPAAAAIGAAASVLLPMAALHVAWVWGGAMYVRRTRQMRVRGAAPLDASILKRNFAIGALGKWRTAAADGPLTATRSVYRVAWNAAGETLYNDYCGGGYGMLAVAHFVIASQALQGVAQSAGEFVRGADAAAAARASCTAAASAQLFLMVGVTAVLQTARPQRVHRNYYSELLPTITQVGLCVLVVLLAERRSTSDTSNTAQVATAVDVTSMLQPVMSIALTLLDAVV
jgi:hypothetical protein